MSVSKDAVEAGLEAFYGRKARVWLKMERDEMERALTAALPFLARPAPSQSDEERAIELIHRSNCSRVDIIAAFTAVRAAERERWEKIVKQHRGQIDRLQTTLMELKGDAPEAIRARKP